MVKLDELDISLIKYIGLLGEPVTTTNVVKYIYAPKNNHEFKLKDNFIRTRLKNLVNKKVLKYTEEQGCGYYDLTDSYVVLSGKPVISINGTSFKGDSGVYVLVLKNDILASILS